MYMRGAKVTFTNKMMKDSVLTFMSQNTDLLNAMMITFRVHLAENQLLLIQVFPDQDRAAEHDVDVAPLVEQIKQMGAKIEHLEGEMSHFKVAGELTLDQLNNQE